MATILPIGIGNVPNDGTGDTIRDAFDKCNQNFNALNLTSENTMIQEVKAAVALTKGQAVYISGATSGTALVSKASNVSDAFSNKTLGLITTTLAINDIGSVITDGILSGLNTSGATAGDPVWLGVNGALLYGIANKPLSPNNLVLIGYVLRVDASNGSIYVKVKVGFELEELDNVAISSPTNGDLLQYNSSNSLWQNKSLSVAGIQTQLNGTGFVKASGTTISYDNTTYYPYPTGTTSQYIRGDGSLATFTTGTPTLNEVLTAGNTSQIDANVGILGLYDSFSGPYSYITGDKNRINFYSDPTTRLGYFGDNTIAFDNNAFLISIKGPDTLTANRTIKFPNATGTVALTSDIPVPTLDYVLAEGNTSLSDAYIGALGLWDNSNAGYATIQANDYNFTFKDYNNDYVLFAEQGILALSKTNVIAASLSTTSLTASRNYLFPDQSGTLALTSDISGFISGSGTTNFVPKFSSASSITDSVIYDNGGNVGIGTSNPSAKLDVAGDALINGVRVGTGPGNQMSNTVLGSAAFANNSSGFGCVVIGSNNSYPPSGNIVDFNNTLSISKGSSAVGDGWPHIWAPEDVSTTSTVEVIAAEGASYAAMFVEYVIQDDSGSMRGGYIKGIWSSDLSTLKMTEETTSSIGVTTDYVFDLVDNGSNSAALQLTSINGTVVYCSVTSRLLTRPE